MSDRHVHITSYLYDTDPGRLAAFEAEARKHFVLVQPVTFDGRTIAFVLYSKDGGAGDDLIYTLPRASQALSGILAGDIEVVSAWEGGSRQRQVTWPVSGQR